MLEVGKTIMDCMDKSPTFDVPLPKFIKDESLEPQVKIMEDEINNQTETPRDESKGDREGTLLMISKVRSCKNKSNADFESVCNLCQSPWPAHRKNPDKFECCQCDRLFHCKSLVVIHQRNHTGETPYECEFCEKTFTEKRIYKEHKNIHLDTKPFPCIYCSESFAQRSGLNRHFKQYHLKIKPFECSICHKRFTFCADYKKHLSSHSDYFQSNKTDDKSSNKTSYDETLIHQTGVESVPCHICNKPFFDKSLLTTHVNSHLGIKPHTCDVCGKSFTQSSGLIKHKHVHTGLRPFVCSTCNKSFAEKTYFRLHVRSHLKQKHTCHICSKTFSWRATLTKHLKLHSEEEKKE